jgi:hypothetical protein
LQKFPEFRVASVLGAACLLACRSETPLHRAAHYGHAAVAAALLSHGVDSSAKESVEG